jgi:hypothetical protein
MTNERRYIKELEEAKKKTEKTEKLCEKQKLIAAYPCFNCKRVFIFDNEFTGRPKLCIKCCERIERGKHQKMLKNQDKEVKMEKQEMMTLEDGIKIPRCERCGVCGCELSYEEDRANIGIHNHCIGKSKWVR